MWHKLPQGGEYAPTVVYYNHTLFGIQSFDYGTCHGVSLHQHGVVAVVAQ